MQSEPGLIHWVLKPINPEGVINHTSGKGNVLIDLIENLYKEQRSDKISSFPEVLIQKIDDTIEPLKKEEVDSHSKEDKMVWTLFSGLHKADRFITTTVLPKRDDVLFPGYVKQHKLIS